MTRRYRAGRVSADEATIAPRLGDGEERRGHAKPVSSHTPTDATLSALAR
jgi:hypothetical protein